MARQKNLLTTKQVGVNLTEKELQKLETLVMEGTYGANRAKSAAVMVTERARNIYHKQDLNEIQLDLSSDNRAQENKTTVTLSLTTQVVDLLEGYLKARDDKKAGFSGVNDVSDFIELIVINALQEELSRYSRIQSHADVPRNYKGILNERNNRESLGEPSGNKPANSR